MTPQIAELVAEHKELESLPQETPTKAPLSERNVNLNAVGQLRFRRETLQCHPENVCFDNQENFQFEHDDGSASTSSYTPSSADAFSIPVGKPTKAEVRAQKKAKKSAKSQSKALKNQNKHFASITLTDVDNIAQILHGEEKDTTLNGAAHPLATDKTIEDVITRNLNFVKNIRAHKEYLFRSVATGRKEAKERKRLKKKEGTGESTEDAVEMDEVVSAIMIKLGISPKVVLASVSTPCNTSNSTPLRSTNNTFSSGRKRAAPTYNVTPVSPCTRDNNGTTRSAVLIATKLRNAIKVDLEKHENEAHARYVRAGGFWRYVGKTVFERMTDIARDLDVSSGEKWEKKWAREGRVCASSENLAPQDTS